MIVFRVILGYLKRKIRLYFKMTLLSNVVISQNQIHRTASCKSNHNIHKSLWRESSANLPLMAIGYVLHICRWVYRYSLEWIYIFLASCNRMLLLSVYVIHCGNRNVCWYYIFCFDLKLSVFWPQVIIYTLSNSTSFNFYLLTTYSL